MEISEKLLNIVLEKELEKKYDGSYTFICNGIINSENNEVSSTLGFYDSEIDFFINIYELAHKCKEWAYKYHKIIINSRTTSKTKDINGYAEIIKSCDYLYGDYADTEVEAIFKACQWILDNKAL